VAASERAWLPMRLARHRARALKGVESGVLCEYRGQVMFERCLQRQSTGARLPTRGHATARPIQSMQVHRVRHESSGKWSAVCGCAVCVCGLVSGLYGRVLFIHVFQAFKVRTQVSSVLKRRIAMEEWSIDRGRGSMDLEARTHKSLAWKLGIPFRTCACAIRNTLRIKWKTPWEKMARACASPTPCPSPPGPASPRRATWHMPMATACAMALHMCHMTATTLRQAPTTVCVVFAQSSLYTLTATGTGGGSHGLPSVFRSSLALTQSAARLKPAMSCPL